MTRHASAHWEGGLKDGSGTLTTETGVLKDQAYTFRSRFEDGKETNPEELLAAAHAACFAMALSAQLGELGLTATSIEVTSNVTMQNLSIDTVHVKVAAVVPGADDAAFQGACERTKTGCPVSKLFRAEITMDASLGG